MTIANYNTYVDNLANFLVISSTDVNYQNALPNIIDDAEQRIYRELDLFHTLGFTLTTTALSNPYVATPSTMTDANSLTGGRTVVVERVGIYTPVGTFDVVNHLMPMSFEALSFLYPSSIGSGLPQFWAPFSQDAIYLGPWPDAVYDIEFDATFRPTELSASNVTTVLTAYFPDLFMAASLVMSAGYMKNFGSMADDPKAAMSWEQHYQTLMQSAQTEEARKKLTSQGWSPKQPAPLATPPRT
jgi:hypothetical protein